MRCSTSQALRGLESLSRCSRVRVAGAPRRSRPRRLARGMGGVTVRARAHRLYRKADLSRSLSHHRHACVRAPRRRRDHASRRDDFALVTRRRRRRCDRRRACSLVLARRRGQLARRGLESAQSRPSLERRGEADAIVVGSVVVRTRRDVLRRRRRATSRRPTRSGSCVWSQTGDDIAPAERRGVGLRTTTNASRSSTSAGG